MTEDKESNEENATTTPSGSSLPPRQTKTCEELSEEYDGWDENIHTYTSIHLDDRRNRGNHGDTGHIFRKDRSQSFSETPMRRKAVLHGTAKDLAMLSRKHPTDDTSPVSSTPSLTNGKHDPEFCKAINDYHSRHHNSIIREKHYDSLIGAPEYVLRRTSMATNKSKPTGGPHQPHVTTRQFNRSIYWLLHNTRKYDLRRVFMLLILAAYTLLGAAMFFVIETRYEHQVVAERKVALDKKIELIAAQLVMLQNSSSESLINNRLAEDFVKSAYISLLKDESLYTGSTFYKSADIANYKWTYASAIFFSMNVYTATGYGAIFAESFLGRICVVWYSLLTIPITLVVIRDLGQWLLVHSTKIYAHILIHFRRTMGYAEPNDDSMISLPIKICLLLLAGYLMFATVCVYFFDDWMGDLPHTGLSFFNSFYFSYISITTIGLGDIMPNNATFHPFITVLFLFGMPVMKVVNRATYLCIENGIFGAFTLIESSIDNLTSKIQPHEEEPPLQASRKLSRCSYCSNVNEEEQPDQALELLNSLTIRSLAAFATANSDVYGGGFGRVNLRKGDLVHSKTSVNQNQTPT